MKIDYYLNKWWPIDQNFSKKVARVGIIGMVGIFMISKHLTLDYSDKPIYSQIEIYAYFQFRMGIYAYKPHQIDVIIPIFFKPLNFIQMMCEGVRKSQMVLGSFRWCQRVSDGVKGL